jgi:DNA-binding MarR family transcriptional regulator
MSWEMPGQGQPGRRGLEVAFEESLRRTSSFMHLMSQSAAERIGINPTDLNCLNILSFSGHMTAGELARATGLTTASITGVIDRLEEAGYVSRERDTSDRRRVVVTLSLDQAMRNVASVFLPIMRDWRELAARYTDDELRLIVDFYRRMEQVFRDHLIRLRTEGRDG